MTMRVFLLSVLLSAFCGSLAFAQGEPSGFELALHGTTSVLAGRPARFRGIAYKIRGLAELHALAKGQVRARYQSAAPKTTPEPWQTMAADARGFFQLDVPIPEGSAGSANLEVSVGDGTTDRIFTFPIQVEVPWVVDLMTDRKLYEPGETVHVWGRLRDQRSRRPIAQQSVTFNRGPTKITATTDESGVVAVEFPIPKEATEGSYDFSAQIGSQHLNKTYVVGTRTVGRLFSEVKVTPETANPGQPVEVSVQVTDASGSPVRNAAVVIRLDKEQTAAATSNSQGLARVTINAPTYTTGNIGTVPIRAECRHPAYGATVSTGSLRLVVPLTLTTEAVPPNGGLVPEIEEPLYLRIKDGAGLPPPVGTALEVTGAAVVGGKQQLKTDLDGIAVARTKLPLGATTLDEEDGATTTVKVRVEGPLARIAAIDVPVNLHLNVVPTVDKPVAAPGDNLTVTLLRRKSALGRPVVVELLLGSDIVDTRVADAQTNKITLRLPRDLVGVLQVRARSLTQAGTVEGEGGVDALLVRPPRPSFPALHPDRPLYDVRTTAKLTLKTRADAPKSWVAVLVRDLAQNQGEPPFVSQFLSETFDRAVLEPDNATKVTFLRTVLAAYLVQDKTPVGAPALVDALGRPQEEKEDAEAAGSRNVLRDPFPLADELRRRGIAKVMKDAEAALVTALDNGNLGEITVGRGVGRHFRPALIEQLDDVPHTLGAGDLTLTMLENNDPSFTYHNVARRVARSRLVRLLVALSAYLDPGDSESPLRRAAAREPYGRWLLRMVARGLIQTADLSDPWGGRFALRPTRRPSLIVALEAAGLELCSAGPDGVFGTADDVRDVFARVVPAGTPYAIASGEDTLMDALSYLSPAETVLTRLLEAYKRVAAEVKEEERGDAVSAQISEGAFSDEMKNGGIGLGNLGTVAHGSGSGSGGSYGSKAGNLRGRRAAAPDFELAQLVREKFPPTLLFLPSVPLDPSGVTAIEVKLTDAATTYLVEAIVWSQDGWTWTADTLLRVDKKTVVDAPVPHYAMVGDSLLLPVRVRNGDTQTLSAAIVVSAEGDSPIQRSGLSIAAGDTVEIPVPLLLSRPMQGKVLIGLQSAAGEPLDAVRRPLSVLTAARRVRQSEDLLVRGTGTLMMEVPAPASPREGAEVVVQVGLAMFGVPDEPAHEAWQAAWLGQKFAGHNHMGSSDQEWSVRFAYSMSTNWILPTVTDARLTEQLTMLTRELGKLKGETLLIKAGTLLALAPAAHQLSARSTKAADLEGILRSLRKELTSNVASAKDDPTTLATLAAALAATAPAGADRSLVRELLRRVRRSEVRVGSDTWIAASGKRRHLATALVALVEIILGEPDRAFERVRTLARIERDGGNLDRTTRMFAHLVSSLLSQGPEPTTVNVEIDGKVNKLALEQGAGRLPAAVLAQPGKHRIHVEVPGGHAAVYVRAATEYGMPWDFNLARPGSLRTTIEGKTNARDQRAALELVVQNRSPRTIGRPVLEVTLPAGAELDEEGRTILGALTVSEPEATRGTLHLELRALPAGSTRRLPLPVRWSVAGHLGGLGIAAYPADQPEDVSITKPRYWDIAAAELTP